MKDTPQHTSSYWVDVVCDALEESYPDQDLIVSSGISPSGPYHVGHSREVLTADAIVRGFQKRGRTVRHTHFVDCFDALRKRYPYLPESYEQEAGKPLFSVPAPDGKSESYAHQYFNEYLAATKRLGIEMEVIWTPDEYKKGKYTEFIAVCMKKRPEIAKIITRVSGRQLEDDWLPIQILDETNDSLRTAKFIGFDEQTNLVHYIGSDGKEYDADISKGQVKLDWRLDWPARWKIWGNQVEGFGRDHATKGGSYDTGKAIIEELFGLKAPYPIPYEFINLKGDTKKMSSSVGNLVSINDALDLIPAEVFRYFTFKSRPERQLFFDPTLGLYNLMDEYAKTESETLAGEEPEFKDAWQIASLSGKDHVISTVPFSHLVSSYQAARGDLDEIFTILTRSGHAEVVKRQVDALKKELVYVKKWLETYAPDNVKFEVLKDAPKLDLNGDQEAFLENLLNKLQGIEYNAEKIHQLVYDEAVATGLGGKGAFMLIYEMLIGKDSGPRAGYFLASLGKDFALKRIEEVLKT